MKNLGLRRNWQQFSLLVLVNAFVGGMVGLERSMLPLLASEKFGVEAQSAILSFIIAFGTSKALANYLMGKWADRFGRKRFLILGWLFAIPVPFLLLYAPTWNWIIVANLFLGINQGLAWSSTVIMKIDLVGEEDRGLAMGINEFAGYLAVALVTFLSGWIAAHYGMHPFPFYIGFILVFLGLMFSVFLIEDTQGHAKTEGTSSDKPILTKLFWQTSLGHPQLGSITQAGLINNLNDGMIWGMLPLILASRGFSLTQIGIVTAAYPAIWGLGQLFTGKMADIYCKKDLLFWGMVVQAFALILLISFSSYGFVLSSAVLLGWGTAMVYPTFMAAIADTIHPQQRAESIGIFRLWRDLGYAIGALLTGIIADYFGIYLAFMTIVVLTIMSAIIIQVRMSCTIPHRKRLLKYFGY